MAEKPTDKLEWVKNGEAARQQEPTGSKKLTGWLSGEKPPFNYLNWLHFIQNKWNYYFGGNAQYNVIIDSDTDEGNYTSLAAYVADSPSAGDRVLTKVDEVLTATLVFPADIEITQQKGNKFTLATNFSPIIQFGDNVKTKGDLRVENSDTGTIAKGFSLNGDNNHHDNLVIENISTGTITDGVYIEAAKAGNYGQARSINSGGGAITNDLTDNSGIDENKIEVRGDAGISKSEGANRTLETVKWSKGADIASASALAPGNDGNYHDVTGTTDIDSINSVGIGTIRRFHFNGSLTINHDVTDLVLPEGQNIDVKAGDELTFIEYQSGDWRLLSGSNIGVNVKVGSFTRDTSLVSGPQAVTGVGFTPRAVIFFTNKSVTNSTYASWGLDDGSDKLALWDNHQQVTDTYRGDIARSIFIHLGGSDLYVGNINSFDSDGFTIAWGRSGTPTDILGIFYLAMG